jgi:Tfp pilus assembly protein PilO
MKGMTAKNKIAILVIVWLCVSAAMFLWFFKILDGVNQATLNAMAQDRTNLVVLQAQDQSYKQAQTDLKQLAAKTNQPDNFFTRDIALVGEIQTLEDLSQKYNVQMQISGVSGTVNNLPQAKATTPLAMVSYGISLTGGFVQVVNFIESLEHLSFVTNVTTLSLTSGSNNTVNAGLSANFYLRK